MKNLLALLMVAAVSGCASLQHIPNEVKVLISLPCEKPNAPARPALPISKLTASSLVDDALWAYVQTVEVLQGYALGLEPLVGKCKPIPGTTP